MNAHLVIACQACGFFQRNTGGIETCDAPASSGEVDSIPASAHGQVKRAPSRTQGQDLPKKRSRLGVGVGFTAVALVPVFRVIGDGGQPRHKNKTSSWGAPQKLAKPNRADAPRAGVDWVLPVRR